LTAWGGVLRKTHESMIYRYLLSQGWALLMVLIGVSYAWIKKPEMGSYSALFAEIFIRQSYSLLIFNLIPFPPFDASGVYIREFLQLRIFPGVLFVLKIVLLFVLFYDFWRSDYLTGVWITRSLGL